MLVVYGVDLVLALVELALPLVEILLAQLQPLVARVEILAPFLQPIALAIDFQTSSLGVFFGFSLDAQRLIPGIDNRLPGLVLGFAENASGLFFDLALATGPPSILDHHQTGSAQPNANR